MDEDEWDDLMDYIGYDTICDKCGELCDFDICTDCEVEL